jgi:23S rRNA pseudouridine2605 synthase
MRLNVFIASSSDLSRRKADAAIAAGRVKVNGKIAGLGTNVENTDIVELDEARLTLHAVAQTIRLNKPAGYVCSRNGQGSKTIYELLPPDLHHLNPVGRLDKESSGLLIMTTDGQLANSLTHPSFKKTKVYEVMLDKPLAAQDESAIENGVMLNDGISQLSMKGAGKRWTVAMSEGRNRQIRRTFSARGYKVTKLHRTMFGPFDLKELQTGKFDHFKI